MITVVSAQPWMDQGLCLYDELEYFYPDWNDEWLDIEHAKNLCLKCPVKAQCLNYALQNNDDEGIWGGLLPEERESMRIELTEMMASGI